ncbi:hypothetical protein SAMN04489802_4370 [Pseudomonas chlororaphis]|uniref:hypothetical protein n=1 Tax=Pseudomonas chlororaphis TaxID=587753 RepID=UPI0008799894|nr:hypothetical protein [Pseudomonas chlororaphis]AZD66022.1 hypothetical protein C4K17_2136 [Pseudomonas chlororaphis subsp. aurantiaca]WDH06273.1 hypothetical protein PUP57_11530 [Pseudomonas chlororaphis]WDH10972.1 hypothetical protein PUP64_03250 [Pseudomonas chlororaphis]SDT41419.1 hypothetical protein SAMN04489802_4370 [Pseudomonas chlororaphis]
MSSLETFALRIPDLAIRSAAELIDFFVYYLTVVEESPAARATEVARCFSELRIAPYSNVSAYLSNNSNAKKGKKFIKSVAGYVLSRNSQLDIQKSIHTGPARIETSLLLRKLLPSIHSFQEQNFLQEAIDCYEIGARRSAIVMTWLLTVDHLCKYVFEKKLADFNSVLASNNDKRVKLTVVSKEDDFSEIPEGKLIEFLRQAGIISNDVRKILEMKLGIRNSAAHPAAITVSEVKATEFIIDLVENIIIKYPRG